MSDDDFSYIHAVDGKMVTSARLNLYLSVSWNKVVIVAPHLVAISFTSKDEVIRCRDVIREHVRADRVNRSGRLTLNLEAWSLKEYVNLLNLSGIHHAPRALKKHILEDVHQSMVSRRTRYIQNIMVLKSLIPALPSDQDQDFVPLTHTSIMVTQGGRSDYLPRVHARGVSSFLSRIPAVRWDKLDNIIGSCDAPFKIEER